MKNAPNFINVVPEQMRRPCGTTPLIFDPGIPFERGLRGISFNFRGLNFCLAESWIINHKMMWANYFFGSKKDPG